MCGTIKRHYIFFRIFFFFHISLPRLLDVRPQNLKSNHYCNKISHEFRFHAHSFIYLTFCTVSNHFDKHIWLIPIFSLSIFVQLMLCSVHTTQRVLGLNAAGLLASVSNKTHWIFLFLFGLIPFEMMNVVYICRHKIYACWREMK